MCELSSSESGRFVSMVPHRFDAGCGVRPSFTVVFVWYLCFFAESAFGQDTNIQDRKLQCFPPQQTQRPVQRSPGVHGETNPRTTTPLFIYFFSHNQHEQGRLIAASPWKCSSDDLRSHWMLALLHPCFNYRFLELARRPIRAAHCGFTR